MTLVQLDEHKVNRFFEKMKESLIDLSYYLPIRVACYYSGALLIKALLTRNNFDYDDVKKLTIGNINNENAELFDDSAVELVISERLSLVKEKIDKAINENNIVLGDGYKLAMFNCYDAMYVEPYLTSTYFMSYEEDNEIKFLYGDFIIEVGQDRIINKVYKINSKK